MNKQEWYESGLAREFQDVIQAWQDRTGLSELAAAHLCGFSQSVINRWKSKTFDYLVQPTEDKLKQLAPQIGIDLSELSRLAGRRDDPVPAASKPIELQMFLRDMEAAWWAAPDHERTIRTEVARAAMPHTPKRPNRRIKRNDTGLDQPKGEYRVHKLVA